MTPISASYGTVSSNRNQYGGHTTTGTTWRTVGVGPNIIEAAWEALIDALFYGLLKAGVEPNP